MKKIILFLIMCCVAVLATIAFCPYYPSQNTAISANTTISTKNQNTLHSDSNISVSQNIQDNVQCITILHTNDHHGQLDPFDKGDYEKIGGITVVASMVQDIRKEVEAKNGSTLLFDCGDVSTGDPVSNHFHAEPDIKVMNFMKYDAMTLGNHEFDLTLENLKKQEQLAEFPYLSANVVYSETNKPIFKTHITLNVQGLNIGVFGIAHPKTPATSTHGGDERIRFITPEEAIPTVLNELKNKNVDYIIGLMHLEPEYTQKLAEQFPAINLILGGHSHTPIMKAIQVGNTWIAEAGSNSMMIGKWDLEFRNKKLEKIDYKLCGVNFTNPYKENGQIVCMPYGKTYKASEEAEKILQPYKDKMKELLEVLGTATENIIKNDRLEEFKSSPLGNLLCDAMKEECKEYKVDIVLQNAGGLRADLQKGEITKKSIATILPFHNTIIIYKMEKSDIENILKHMVSGNVQPGGYLEVTGLKVQLENTSIKSLKLKKPINKSKIYHVAVNSFTAGGGDGYTMFQNMKPYKELETTLSEALEKYIKRHKTVSPTKEIRIEWKQTNN